MLKNEYLEQLNCNRIISFVPSGNSMWPTLKNKKQSVLVQKKTERLKKFDVALYCRKDGKTVLHRVIEVLENSYIIQGDSQDYVENVDEDNVVGVMIGFYKGKKYIKVEDERYQKKVEKWFKSETRRKRKCKVFFLKIRVINKLKSAIKKLRIK